MTELYHLSQNNEVAINQSYIDNLKSLDNFVMLMFDQDKTVVPRESSWFSSFPIDRGGEESQDKRDKNATLPIPLRKSPIYTHDRLGLKSMDRRGALIFESECLTPFGHLTELTLPLSLQHAKELTCKSTPLAK